MLPCPTNRKKKFWISYHCIYCSKRMSHILGSINLPGLYLFIYLLIYSITSKISHFLTAFSQSKMHNRGQYFFKIMYKHEYESVLCTSRIIIIKTLHPLPWPLILDSISTRILSLALTILLRYSRKHLSLVSLLSGHFPFHSLATVRNSPNHKLDYTSRSNGGQLKVTAGNLHYFSSPPRLCLDQEVWERLLLFL